MRLISVTVEHFRTLRGTTTVVFGEGLNVVHAPNETGKSTLFEAIQTVLTLKSKATGAPRRHIVSRPESDPPAVTLVFAYGGTTCTLRKRFAKASGTTTLDLMTPAGTESITDTLDAEVRLRDLLQVDDVARGAPKPEHLGIWPLLWSKQTGTDHSPTAGLSEGARGTLGQKLSELSGSVLAGSGGDALVDTAVAEHQRYHTTTGQPAARGPLKQAMDAAAQSQAESEELDRREAEHADTTRRYADLATELTQLDTQRPEAMLKAKRAEEKAREAEAMQQQVASARQQQAIATAQHDEASRRVAARREARQAVADLANEQKTRHRALAEAARIANEHNQQHDALALAAEQARNGLAEITQQIRHARQRLERLRRRDESQRLRAALDQAEALDTKRRAARRAAEAETLDDRTARRLEKLTRAHEDALLALRSAAATVRLEPLGGPLPLVVDDEPEQLSAARDLPATAPLRVELPGQLRITVTPGGDEIANLRQAVEEADRALTAALGEAGVPDALTAARRVATAKERAAEAKIHADLLRAHAPDGLDALRDRLAAAEPDTSGETDTGTTPAEAEAQVAELEAAEHARQQADQTARARRQAHRDAAQQHQHDHGIADVHAQRADDDLAAAKNKLDASLASDGPDADLADAAETADAARSAAEEALAAARKNAAATPADVARADADRLGRVLTALDEEARKHRDEQISLEALLQSGGHLGLGERADAARERHAQARRTLAAETRRAEAARRLATTLTAARERARAAHLAPLRDQAIELLQLVFPGADPGFDESFDLIRITRPGGAGHAPTEAHAFNDLSAGAKEQVGLVLRLAMARVLADGGCLPLLLDDTLVATDAPRFERIARVLDHCAPPLQIILATCDWPRHRVLGLPPENVIDLAALRAGSAE